MGNRQGKRDSEQAGISAPDIPPPKEQKSSDRTHVGVASFVVQDNSRVEQSHTDSKFIAIDSSTHLTQPLLDGTDGDSEQAGTSTFGASNQTMSMSGDHTQVGSTLALAQKGGIVQLNFHGTATDITMGSSVHPFLDTKRPCDQVVTALSLAQSESKVSTRKSQRSTHIKNTSPNQDSVSSKSEEIGKLFKKVIDKSNSGLCIQDNLISKIKKLLPKDSREIFSMMVEILNYYMRNKKSLEFEYRTERALSFKEGNENSFKPVTYEELKELILEATPRHVAIAGPAGAGKSTLLKRIVRDLSGNENNVLSEKLIVFLNFRDLYSEKDITPRELLFHGLFEDKSLRVECYKWILENQEKVIFLLDGLDQARFSVSSKAMTLRPHSKGSASDIISNILNRKLFQHSKIVYTSREHSISSLEDPLRPDKVISLTGFLHDDAEYLFTNAVDNGKDLWNKMEASIKALVTIPVFLTFTILAYIYIPDSPPTSMTEIMQKLFETFMRSENLLNRDASGKIPIPTLKGLQELSFIGLRERKLSFNSENFDGVGLNLQDVRDFVIVVPGIDFSTFCVFEVDYVVLFTHQSIQEFFAAQYIVQLELESFRKTVYNQLKSDYWSVVTRFVSGILLNKKSQFVNAKISDLTEKQKILKSLLTKKYGKGDATVSSKLSTLASIAETEDTDFIQFSVKNIALRSHPIGISGISSIASIMHHCSHLENLDLDRCGLSADQACFLWRNIAHSRVKINKLSVSLNSELGNGFQHICKIAAHCDVRELRVSNCNFLYSQFSCLKDIKSSQLRLYRKELPEDIFSVIGEFIGSGGELFLPEIPSNIVSGVQLLEKALGTKKLKGLHLGIADSTYYFSMFQPDKVPDTFFASLGNIIADNGSLTLRCIDATSSGLQRLKFTLDKKKISRLDLSNSKFEAPCYEVIGNIVKSCSIDELSFAYCTITGDALDHFTSAAEGAKTFSLDFSSSKFDASCCEVVGNIVKSCSIYELSLFDCEITDDALDQFLSAAEGAKLTELELCYNLLSQAAIERIRKSLTVENLLTFPRQHLLN